MKKLWKVIVLAMLLSLLMACGQDATDTENTGTNEDAAVEESETEAEDADYPLTLTDALGNEVTLEEEPERVVSLIPSNTELTFALGQGDKVVGVSDHDNYPEEVLGIDKIGGMELNVEVIVGLEPDIVLAHESGVSYAQEAFDQLKDAGVNIFVVQDAQNIADTYEAINVLGQILGATKEAEQLIDEMKQGFAELEELTATVAEEDRQSVFFEVSPAPDIYTVGQNTFMHELLEVINAENATGDQDGWVAMDPEAIIDLNPDVIVITYGDYVENAHEQVLTRDGFDVVGAVANERVYDVDSDTVTRPGPRLVGGAEELAKAVYPELFDEE